MKMKAFRTVKCLSTITVILSSLILLMSCTSNTGTVTDGSQQKNSSETATAQIEQSVTPANTPTTMTTAQTTTPTGTTTTTTTTASTTAVQANTINIPVVGAEFSMIPNEYDMWTVLKFDYNVIHEQGTDYHFPWSLTIKNDTETDLELTAYIIHWGFHGWVGWVSETPFILKGWETKNLSGEDIMTETFFDGMVHGIEDAQIEIYIAEG